MSNLSDRVLGTPPTNTPKFQPGHIRLSPLMQDPFVRAAFERAEHDQGDDFGELVDTDHPKHLDGGAAEVIGDTGRHILALVEG